MGSQLAVEMIQQGLSQGGLIADIEKRESLGSNRLGRGLRNFRNFFSLAPQEQQGKSDYQHSGDSAQNGISGLRIQRDHSFEQIVLIFKMQLESIPTLRNIKSRGMASI
jgi:hypothetical protein